MQDNSFESFSVKGKVAVITGAASGIGRGIATAFAAAGAAVVLADVNEAGLAETQAQIEADGGQALSCTTNVADRAAVEALMDAAVRWRGRIDIAVNAAGILMTKPIVDVEPADLDRILGVNLTGVYWCCAAAARHMLTQRAGSIINLSSVGADLPVPGLSLYALTKAAVSMLTQTAATEFGPHGIRVNAIAPGFIDTPMVSYMYRDEAGHIDAAKRDATFEMRARGAPLGIIGTPQDIAQAALYLASDASRYVTGQVLRVNGGTSMR